MNGYISIPNIVWMTLLKRLFFTAAKRLSLEYFSEMWKRILEEVQQNVSASEWSSLRPEGSVGLAVDDFVNALPVDVKQNIVKYNVLGLS